MSQAPASAPLQAPLKYLVEAGETPVFYASEGGGDETRYLGRYEERVVALHDGRAAGPLALDRAGFVLLHHDSAVADFYDDAEIARVYTPEIEALVKAATGAVRVLVFDYTRRSDSQATQAARKIRDPASIVHNDYTERSAPRRLRDLLPAAEAERLLKGRVAVVNVWRPIRGPVTTTPLALCDAASVAPGDLVASERRAKGRVGEIQQALYNPAHRWYWFPDMRPDEAVLIKTYDSATDGRARYTLHTAFRNPTAAPDAAPRESIEARCFVFF